jgi:prevent-host-death family protein
MRTVGLKTLKNKLSEYVRAAASGETVIVTDRGRVVAKLVRVPEVPERLKQNPVLARGVLEGWITPATITDGSPPPRKPVPGLTFEQLMADLEKDREDRW